MAENSSNIKCCLNLIGILVYVFLMIACLCFLLYSTSISLLFFGIMVSIAALLIGILCLVFCCDSECIDIDCFMNFIIFCIRLLCSCVLGLMSFVDISAIQNEVIKTIITCMLFMSIVIKAIWLIEQQYYGLIEYPSSTVTWTEMLQLVGFSVTGFVFLPKDQALFSKYALFLILVSFAFTVVALRLVAFFYNPYVILFLLVLFTVCQVIFFSTVDLPVDGVALGCFAGHLFIAPIFDSIFSNISFGEKLNSMFSIHGCFQKMFILMVIVFEVIFLFHAGVSAIYLKWDQILFFIGLLLFWICCHLYIIHLCWDFSNKLSECSKAFQALGTGNTSMDKMMATKGIRLQAQLAHCLVRNTFDSTMLLGIVVLIPIGVPAWHKDEKAALAASCLIVLLIEGMFFVATDTLRKLPGACTACIIMPPSSFHGQSELLQSRDMWNYIMQFFKRNAIPCSVDTLVNGQSVKTLGEKLQLFFNQTIPETKGVRYDSYVVYYCGDVEDDGKWKLIEGKFQFEMMQLLWKSCNTEGFQSRLILIQDAECSKDWLKKIANDKTNVIAMQTCKLSRSGDPETGSVARVGDFTQDWIEFNSSTVNSINWKERGRKVKAVYRVSPSWSDYELHMPTQEDIEEYMTKFPKILKSLIKNIILYLGENMHEKKICGCWKRFMMNWFPPRFIDTGHGFKLIKS